MRRCLLVEFSEIVVLAYIFFARSQKQLCCRLINRQGHPVCSFNPMYRSDRPYLTLFTLITRQARPKSQGNRTCWQDYIPLRLNRHPCQYQHSILQSIYPASSGDQESRSEPKSLAPWKKSPRSLDWFDIGLSHGQNRMPFTPSNLYNGVMQTLLS